MTCRLSWSSLYLDFNICCSLSQLLWDWLSPFRTWEYVSGFGTLMWTMFCLQFPETPFYRSWIHPRIPQICHVQVKWDFPVTQVGVRQIWRKQIRWNTLFVCLEDESWRVHVDALAEKHLVKCKCCGSLVLVSDVTYFDLADRADRLIRLNSVSICFGFLAWYACLRASSANHYDESCRKEVMSCIGHRLRQGVAVDAFMNRPHRIDDQKSRSRTSESTNRYVSGSSAPDTRATRQIQLTRPQELSHLQKKKKRNPQKWKRSTARSYDCTSRYALIPENNTYLVGPARSVTTAQSIESLPYMIHYLTGSFRNVDHALHLRKIRKIFPETRRTLNNEVTVNVPYDQTRTQLLDPWFCPMKCKQLRLTAIGSELQTNPRRSSDTWRPSSIARSAETLQE